ncbi:hypothetical protein J1605_015137 [Eschrichtius robustus]|uniref:Uncharacterized protein n=1 Tax=Eschrichtius robustus TaxID=9764 RepID=A0AB34GBV3_ESCRO|nr:hypothetical protein J1605_015137 [Eschrichtius robustus]
MGLAHALGWWRRAAGEGDGECGRVRDVGTATRRRRRRLLLASDAEASAVTSRPGGARGRKKLSERSGYVCLLVTRNGRPDGCSLQADRLLILSSFGGWSCHQAGQGAHGMTASNGPLPGERPRRRVARVLLAACLLHVCCLLGPWPWALHSPLPTPAPPNPRSTPCPSPVSESRLPKLLLVPAPLPHRGPREMAACPSQAGAHLVRSPQGRRGTKPGREPETRAFGDGGDHWTQRGRGVSSANSWLKRWAWDQP